MTHQYTNTLPPEVLQQLRSKAPSEGWHRDAWIAEQSAQWGADQELKACCGVLDDLNDGYWSKELRAARRPKPPSLKEQALAVLDDAELDSAHYNILLRALEQLDD